MKILVKVFYTFLCGDLVKMEVKCCERPFHELVQVLVRTSCRGPAEILDLAAILLKSSSRGPCIKLLPLHQLLV